MLGFLESNIDIRANVLFANEFVEAIFDKNTTYIIVDTRKDNLDTFFFRHLDEIGQVVHACRIDEGHLAHTDDTYLRTFFHAHHHLFELVGYTEEIRAIDFIHFHILGNRQVLNVGILCQVGLCSGVYLVIVGEHTHLGGLCHTTHAEEACQHQAHFDGNGQVENDGETESEPKHKDVALGVVHHLTDGAPAAHVVADHYEHARQTCHRDVFGVWHEEEVNQVIETLAALKIFPRQYLEEIAKGDIPAIFNDSVENILKINPGVRVALLEYMISIVMSDKKIAPEEIKLLYNFGESIALSEMEVATAIAEAIQRRYMPSLESIC